MDGLIACCLIKTTSEAEQRYTQQGKAMLSFSAMVFDGKREQDTTPEWLRVTCWGELAEGLSERLPKGSEVYVEGRLRLNEWEASDGQKRSGLALSAWRCDVLGQIGRRRPQPRRDDHGDDQDQPRGRLPRREYTHPVGNARGGWRR